MGAEKVIIIGTDTPTLERQLICQAFGLLDQSHIVIGPTGDGGYYLLGISFHTFAGYNHLLKNSIHQNPKIRGWHGQTSLSVPDSRSNHKQSIVNDPCNDVANNLESENNLSSNNLHWIFSGIEWGTDTVYEETIKKIKQNRLTYQLLPEHYDIDRPEDLYKLRHDLMRKKDLNLDYLWEIYSLLANIPN